MNFLHWLTLLFLGLKLTHYIDWSWWFVVMPLIALYFIQLVHNLQDAE